MFTGLVEEIGVISSIQNINNALYINVTANKIIKGLKIGDSIAINGACQTVIDLKGNELKVYASNETVNVTNFLFYKKGSFVNLERPLKLDARLDGHIVSGHIDTTAKIYAIRQIAETREFEFEIDMKYKNQLVPKGSISVDGISLTIADVTDNKFKITVIPHTYNSTTMKYLKIGDIVNIETDIIGKYIENYLSSNDNINNNITIDLLERNGFL